MIEIGCFAMPLDGGGVYGSFFQYSLFFALMGSAFLAFIYFWGKGRLDMDEAPKLQMMRNEEENEDEWRKR